MAGYSAAEAAESAEKIAKAAKRWKQVASFPAGIVWECNACSFTTSTVAVAEDHAITETRTRPFAHILIEQTEPKVKKRRRIRSPDGRTVRLEAWS